MTAGMSFKNNNQISRRASTFRMLFLTALFMCILLLPGCAGLPRSRQAIKRDRESAKKEIEKMVSDGTYLEKCPMTYNENTTLCVPTQMTKLGEDYFIVDCYHNRIITSKVPDAPLTQWKVLTDEINMGHSIASDGIVYLADDTENARVLVFVKNGEDFYLTQTFENVGERTHYVRYNERDGLFYVLSSLTGEIFTYRRQKGSIAVEPENVAALSMLDGVYIRSFTFIGKDLYLPAGDGNIYVLDTEDFSIKKTYLLAPELGGPTQLSKIGNYFYLTVSTDIYGFPNAANIVRAKKLEDFNSASYESVRGSFCMDGTPYVITPVDEGYYLALHSDYGPNCMWYFEVDKDDNLCNVRSVFQ